jgi:hypothetical protein|tara:strand:+ start:1066 stop:1308 length:243 start_codon:yes stop_codon:yes gene_type:complete
MPVKFGPSQVIVERGTGKKTTTHQYMKCQSIKTLIEKFNNTSTTGRLKRKIKVEFDRRNKIGLDKVVFVDKEVNDNGILG